MKKLIFIISIFILSGCTTYNYINADNILDVRTGYSKEELIKTFKEPRFKNVQTNPSRLIYSYAKKGAT